MRTAMIPLSELQGLAKHGVALLGDSIYTQPIIGSHAANTAIKDAIDLAEHIANNCTREVSDWHERKYATWNAEVEESERRITKMHREPKLVL